MKLLKPAQELLSELYAHYQNTGSLDGQITYSNVPLEKKTQIQSIDQLVMAGLVGKTASAMGFSVIKLTKAGIDYFEETQNYQPQVINFNVSGNVENSILGNQTNATIRIGTDLAQIAALINTINGPDKDKLSSLPDILATAERDGQIKSGMLSKFSGILTKYPKVFDAVGSVLVKLAIGALL